ncbi:hypothetical protein C8F04DRAFT_1274103 [Mycena alexandri]|uniref:F-box domain-containing protein n=1 Tax=Mycena alexandri TaxID=1745969 RepID=A0AAD6S7B9_9AGAR|nr:hypothetical protein C8F04DRAFT_1274103 [Mycena alexandri]
MATGREVIQGQNKSDVDPAISARTRLFQIDTDIVRLGRERQAIAKQLDLRKYSIINLPNEITSEIFQHLLDCDPASDLAHSALLVLGQICRLWRDIMWSLPALWSTISIRANYKTLPRRLTLMEDWLRRSRSLPLSISLKHGPAHNGFTTLGAEGAAAFFKVVRPHFDRLERLEIAVPLRGSDLRLEQFPMPRLVHLGLWCDRCHYHESPVVILPATGPRLSSVELHHFYLESVAPLVLPWTNITTLVCNYIDCGDWRRILEETPALIHCRVSHMRREAADAPTPTTLLHLKSLIFTHHVPEEDPLWSTFPLPEMILPALRTLQIPEIYLPYPAVDTLLQLISDSGCSLKDLRIVDLTHGRQQDYINRLSSIPSISFYRQSTDTVVPTDGWPLTGDVTALM